MASYNPPTENLPTFNSTLFNQAEETLSQAEADKLYLSKTKNDTSTASTTTFNNQISVGGSANFGSSVSLRNRYKIFDYSNIDTDTTHILSVPLSQTYFIRTLSVPTTSITITLPAIDGNDVGRIINFVKFKGTNNLAVTLICGAFNIIPLNEISTLGGLTNTSLLAVDKQMTSLVIAYFGTSYFYLEVSNYSTFDRDLLPKLASPNTFTNTNQFNLGATIFDGQLFNTRQIKSTTPASNSHQIFDNMTTGGVLSIGNALSTNQINGVTTFNQNVNATTILSANYNTSNSTSTTSICSATTTGIVQVGGFLTIGSVNIGNTNLTSTTNIYNRLAIRSTQYLSQVKTISGTSATLTFPLEEICVLSSTGVTLVVITLPTITSSNIGFTFKFTKTGSTTNSVQFVAGGTNVIFPSNSISNVSPYTTMVSTATNKLFMTIETTTTGTFAWKEII